ncbi:STAS/SEC14 domain-containing protein [Mesorhizobium sp. M1C.F.Ca.ET.193.01.1.1]|uniref:STAS/SEC14 domain-containing protein n=1 Tax=unclassified Mesorhizobium TaxID=325217 RepID=UPI000FD55054|nr:MULTISPECIES: STAS/SEC14 domain-containing protein [unclassified Mesorhizobium]TGT02667.1 STAS/SEC14 domain-containing protein [bacterium M00.F.Ca.ET.177.01.1.1]RWA68966.1 MAG: STAS/SEC14 domain-containing protein [Mesorhizobium sp.]RWB98003.1 MAG: STAS/SEC14 domain-containing protein [Mesorhizobium sp.]RWG80457.1 MAG: STAS/SEC14 domain-containing protein [Mesorhizobium sp.]RWG84705.1 MAG: STAS/SEC14 domain-containing protein [Mesorhizobium sp.]
MNFLEAVPAIRRIDTNRDALFAIDVVGDVSPADAENLFGLLQAAYALHPRIDVLVRLTDEESVDWANISENTIRQGVAGALEHVVRCAAIGEPRWASLVGGFFPKALPFEFLHFGSGDEAAAWQWLGARPASETSARSSAARRRE